ncbi:putative scp gapr-1 like scp extracellular protein [Fasciolopsis buskii]|uniref:Putative scp gapr-1 like scp extracellular protein n=1 Tax=Fasciolopsis buskii TaxID=27845 RepID=A0A8E0RV07_9TREM|nr:putative scp gapr-1 like scp extracellular protein [Fasciolopsis buski]
MVDKALNNEFINVHNEYRALHGCGKLKFDMSLARSAQKYAEQLAQLGYMNHSSCDGYGENLAARSSSGVAEMTGREATKMWYDEIILHDFKGGYNGATGHFTQVIWKNTTNAGFGRASTKDGHKIFLVGHYTPPGNVQGEFAENVPRLTSRKKSFSKSSYLPVAFLEPYFPVVLLQFGNAV